MIVQPPVAFHPAKQQPGISGADNTTLQWQETERLNYILYYNRQQRDTFPKEEQKKTRSNTEKGTWLVVVSCNFYGQHLWTHPFANKFLGSALANRGEPMILNPSFDFPSGQVKSKESCKATGRSPDCSWIKGSPGNSPACRREPDMPTPLHCCC